MAGEQSLHDLISKNHAIAQPVPDFYLRVRAPEELREIGIEAVYITPVIKDELPTAHLAVEYDDGHLVDLAFHPWSWTWISMAARRQRGDFTPEPLQQIDAPEGPT